MLLICILFILLHQVKVSTPVLEVKYPFNVNMCEFSLYMEKEKLAQLDDCSMALAALLAAYHVFGISFPQRLHNTLDFLQSFIFDVKCPQLLSVKSERTGKMWLFHCLKHTIKLLFRILGVVFLMYLIVQFFSKWKDKLYNLISFPPTLIISVLLTKSHSYSVLTFDFKKLIYPNKYSKLYRQTLIK